MRPRLLAIGLVLATACAQGQGGDAVDAVAPDGKEDVVDGPPAVDGPRADAGPDAGPATDASVDAPAGTGPDTCAQAQDLTAAAMNAGGVTVTGDTTGYADDIRPPSSCTGYLPDGPDAIYAVTVAAGVTITATATPTPTTWDISLELVQPCTLTPTCLAGADASISGPETLTYTTTAAGTYYVVVDGYNPGVQGPYALNVRLQ
ncbi:MAG: hypothetical protein HS111_26940 [Kofleriaceae bacterium]|nr:hypothetical protein [Kofleriaceae bacterium]MCL4226383.1 hypothetical protein [Myxococcales bacterium]